MCKYRKGYKCLLNLYGGRPSLGVCNICEKYEGPARGAGDLVYKIANPIAGLIDNKMGTKFKECEACKKRREKLNKIIPFKGDN